MRRFFGWLMLAGGLTIISGSALSDDDAPGTNSIGMPFVKIQAGSFMMGTDKTYDNQANNDEVPLHKVTISKPFCLSKYEVTQGQWAGVMGKNPVDEFRGRTLPVAQVSWGEAQEFIRRLNTKENTTRYRLPTEAEWEYAARAGTDTIRYWGDGEDDKGEYAWHESNARGKPHPVGLLKPNAWGLHDMLGNVLEWVADGYDDDFYVTSPATDPRGPANSKFRVLRGGSWRDDHNHIRAANRFFFSQSSRNNVAGVRVAQNCD